MKAFGIASLVLLAGTAFAQDDVEAKKKRLGEIMKQTSQLQAEAEKILKDLAGGDPEKLQAIMREVSKKYAPEFDAAMASAQIAANERNASATLKTLVTAQADFRANDRDNNRVNDFWVADVSGLYRIDVDGAIRLIEQAAATADARPAVPLGKAGALSGVPKEHASKFALLGLGKPTPKTDYWFVAIETYEDENGAAVKYNEGNGRNTSRFGLCAYPAEYGDRGHFTFIISEENEMWKKDTGGKPVERYAKDPGSAGWTKMR